MEALPRSYLPGPPLTWPQLLLKKYSRPQNTWHFHGINTIVSVYCMSCSHLTNAHYFVRWLSLNIKGISVTHMAPIKAFATCIEPFWPAKLLGTCWSLEARPSEYHTAFHEISAAKNIGGRKPLSWSSCGATTFDSTLIWNQFPQSTMIFICSCHTPLMEYCSFHHPGRAPEHLSRHRLINAISTCGLHFWPTPMETRYGVLAVAPCLL